MSGVTVDPATQEKIYISCASRKNATRAFKRQNKRDVRCVAHAHICACTCSSKTVHSTYTNGSVTPGGSVAAARKRKHPGVVDVRDGSDFSRFYPRPERPHFSNFGPPTERGSRRGREAPRSRRCPRALFASGYWQCAGSGRRSKPTVEKDVIFSSCAARPELFLLHF